MAEPRKVMLELMGFSQSRVFHPTGMIGEPVRHEMVPHSTVTTLELKLPNGSIVSIEVSQGDLSKLFPAFDEAKPEEAPRPTRYERLPVI